MGCKGSYSGDPQSSKEDEVRFLIGDTSDPFDIADTEIKYLVDKYGNAHVAAARACFQLSTQFSNQSDKTIGRVKIGASDKATRYRACGNDLMRQLTGGKVLLGGISRQEKVDRASETDRDQNKFHRGMNDNHRHGRDDEDFDRFGRC